MIYIFELIPIFFSGNMLQNSSKEAQYTTISVDQKDWVHHVNCATLLFKPSHERLQKKMASSLIVCTLNIYNEHTECTRSLLRENIQRSLYEPYKIRSVSHNCLGALSLQTCVRWSMLCLCRTDDNITTEIVQRLIGYLVTEGRQSCRTDKYWSLPSTIRNIRW